MGDAKKIVDDFMDELGSFAESNPSLVIPLCISTRLQSLASRLAGVTAPEPQESVSPEQEQKYLAQIEQSAKRERELSAQIVQDAKAQLNTVQELRNKLCQAEKANRPVAASPPESVSPERCLYLILPPYIENDIHHTADMDRIMRHVEAGAFTATRKMSAGLLLNTIRQSLSLFTCILHQVSVFPPDTNAIKEAEEVLDRAVSGVDDSMRRLDRKYVHVAATAAPVKVEEPKPKSPHVRADARTPGVSIRGLAREVIADIEQPFTNDILLDRLLERNPTLNKDRIINAFSVSIFDLEKSGDIRKVNTTRPYQFERTDIFQNSPRDNSKPVVCDDPYHWWDNGIEAGIELGVSAASVGRLCRNNKPVPGKGWMIRYAAKGEKPREAAVLSSEL